MLTYNQIYNIDTFKYVINKWFEYINSYFLYLRSLIYIIVIILNV